MKKTKIFKKITLAGLAACMFCLPILAGCAPAEMLPQNPGPGQNFDLGLNPETDPVVFTTQSGLEIKKSNAKYSSPTTTTSNRGSTFTQDLTSFYYFTMGTFSGTIYVGDTTTNTYSVSNTPVNWLIIGRGPGFNFEASTPAGTAIKTDRDKQEIATSALNLPNFFTSVPEHSDIPEGCFLVLSEKLLGQSYLDSTGAVTGIYTESDYGYAPYGSVYYGNRYRYSADNTSGLRTWNNKKDGTLYTYINNLFSKNTSGTILKNGLGFSQEQSDLIVPQQLYTFYSNGQSSPLADTPSTDGGTYYTMFPLADRAEYPATKQNFCYQDYLKTDGQRVAMLIGRNQSYDWWLRTGGLYYNDCARGISAGGGYSTFGWDCFLLGVRPAMVMKLS